MKICVYVTSRDMVAMTTMTKALKKTIPNFDWELTSDLEAFGERLGVYKVAATTKNVTVQHDLKWPSPVDFLKDKKMKAKVWADIEEKILPNLTKATQRREALKLTDGQLQQLLGMISGSKISFEIDHPDGTLIGVNKTTGVDLSITTADVASMIAASWLFKAKGVRLT
jgi:hypothetical protein